MEINHQEIALKINVCDGHGTFLGGTVDIRLEDATFPPTCPLSGWDHGVR